MVLEHQEFKLANKVVLERTKFIPPLRAATNMERDACFIYTLNGKSTLFGGTQTEKLSTGVGVLMKCGSYVNTWQKNEKDDEPSEAIGIHFYPEVMKLIYEDQVPDFLTNKKMNTAGMAQLIEPNAAIASYIQSLEYYFKNPILATEDLLRLKVKELIFLLYSTDSHGVREVLQDLFSPDQLEFKEVINSHILQNLSVEELAMLTHMSLSSFKRKFKEIFGDSPARYLKQKKLDKAAEMLRVSSSRISEIAFDVGFSDLSHFSKSFTEQFGLSPSQYKSTQ